MSSQRAVRSNPAAPQASGKTAGGAILGDSHHEREADARAVRLRQFATLAVVFLLQLCLFSPLALRRLIDSDEGFYLYISKLVVTQGILPYRDVFYQQAPLLPYLYGAWMRVFGFTWESGRMFSAVLAALIGTLIFSVIWKTSRSRILAVASLFLYASNLSMLLFFLTAKTYALSSFFLFGSMLMAARSRGGKTDWAAGFLFALSAQTRLFFAAAAPAFLLLLWRRDRKSCWKDMTNFLAGVFLGLLPSTVLFFIAPRQFVFNNLTYHALRDAGGLVGDLEQKLQVAVRLVFNPSSFLPTQFSFLLVGLGLALVVWQRLSTTAKLSALLAGALGMVSFLPTPTFGQYFCVVAPFLVICLAEGIVGISARWPAGRRKQLYAAFAFSSLFSAVMVAPRVYSLFWNARNVPGIYPSANHWNISTVEKVAGHIERLAEPDALVVCSWPGYMLSADRKIYPKMENQISVGVSKKISPEEADLYKALRKEDLQRAIADPRAQVVVAGNCANWWPRLYAQAAANNGLELRVQEANAYIYIRPTSFDPSRALPQ